MDHFVEKIKVPDSHTFVLSPPNRLVNPDIVRQVVKACREGLRLDLSYASMNNPKGEDRIIAPHTLVSTGYRWHVRAYCEKRQDYVDFSLGRILQIYGEEGPRRDDPSDDTMWQEVITLRLVPHPDLSKDQQALIRHERCGGEKALEVKTRKATAIYMAQLLQLPTEKTDEARRYPLIIENIEEIEALSFDRR